jgi:SAM-dependent methyltransferase
VDEAVAEAAVLREAALRIDPGNAATFDLLEHAAAHYPALSRGEITGQDALLGLGSVDLWLRYFSNANPLYAVNNWIAATAAVVRLREIAEERDTLCILEIGAGAGSGSERLVDLLRQAELLDRVQRLVITEPSAFLLRKAKRALARRDDVVPAFAGLDINKSWCAQGVEEGSIDLVYAVNVLHVARDLAFTLAEVRRCLAPGGWLVAGECLPPDAGSALSVEMVFRLLEDPEVITDAALRPHSGFLEWRHWQAALQEAGFSAVCCEPDHVRIREVYPKLFVAAVCGRR